MGGKGKDIQMSRLRGRDNNMKRVLLVALISVAAFAICHAESMSYSPRLREGDLLVYTVFREDQDMDIGGTLVKIKDPYESGFLDVMHLTTIVTERFPSQDEEERQFNRSLAVGMKWDQGEGREDNAYCYYVEKKEDVKVPAGIFKGCFKIVYVTCPDDQAWWYCPGIGVVKYEYHHHGTITNILRELKGIGSGKGAI